MQKIATKVFVVSSVLFGVLGILMVLISSNMGGYYADRYIYEIVSRLLMVTVFVILPSFALSFAGKYLKDKK